MSYPASIPLERATDAPAYDEDTLDSNLGIFTDGRPRIMWDKYGPIVEPEAFQKASGIYTHKCYIKSR